MYSYICEFDILTKTGHRKPQESVNPTKYFSRSHRLRV